MWKLLQKTVIVKFFSFKFQKRFFVCIASRKDGLLQLYLSLFCSGHVAFCVPLSFIGLVLCESHRKGGRSMKDTKTRQIRMTRKGDKKCN